MQSAAHFHLGFFPLGAESAITRGMMPAHVIVPAKHTLKRKHMKKQMLVSSVALCLLACASVSASSVVTVTSNPLWTDTGITLAGQNVDITASGSWTWGASYFFGPDGDYQPGDAWDEWFQNGYHGQLIAFVGINPYVGTVNGEEWHWG